MARAVDFSQGIGRKELDAVRRRFMALNQIRLERILAELRPAQQDLLRILPLLFHVNHPLLPGFVNSDTPAGIPDYRPSRSVLDIAKRHFHGFQSYKTAQRSFPILALYIMGSVGSIAHTRGSDLDFWLCHHAGLSEAALTDLATKAQRLEHWAEQLGLEVHFFLMDADKFRGGKFTPLSGDSSGSTQHGLLLEEFYRSALLIAGRHPLWWLVPPEHEADYDTYASELVHKRFVSPTECLDFGGLSEIAEKEFFGAGLWQLYKGVNSPYKSVLKILLTETYAQGFPKPDWLALQIKRDIYQGETDAENLDAYLLMYRSVEANLLERNQNQRLDLARRCLYFKVNEPLTRQSGDSSWRARKMRELVQSWGWDQDRLRDLDGRQKWKIQRVIRERDELVRELNRSYRLLTDFASGHGEGIQVRPEELNLLGRKLYTTLENRPGKVERVNPGISADLSEERLTLRLDTSDSDHAWDLYTGWVKEQEIATSQHVKLTRGLVEMLAWCQVNGIATRDTHFHLLPGNNPLSQRELGRICSCLHEHLPTGSALEAPLSHLARIPHPLTFLIFVNVGGQSPAIAEHDDIQRVSARSDPLSYGAQRECRFTDLELLAHTSWGELVSRRHTGPEELLDALCYYLDMRRRAPQNAGEPCLSVAGHSTPMASALAMRVEQLFRAAHRFFQHTPGGRYLVCLGNTLYLLEHGDRGFGWIAHDNEDEMLDALSAPRTRYSPPGCDPGALVSSPLPAVFSNCQAGEQQLFYHCHRGTAQIYVLDESGSLFRQRFPVTDPGFLLLQQQRFLESLARLRRLSGVLEEAASLVTGPRFYRLEHDLDGGWRILPARLPRRGSDLDFLDLRLLAENNGHHTQVLSLICGGREFSAHNQGEHLFDLVVRHVLGFRSQDGADYPIYLTSVELIQNRYGIPPSGVELLLLKRRMEQRLQQAQNAYQ